MTLDDRLLKKFADKVDIEILRDCRLNKRMAQTFSVGKTPGMTIYTLGQRLDYLLTDGRNNAVMIMKYRGHGEFTIVDEWDEIETGDDGLPTGKNREENQGWNYIQIPYNKLDKMSPGFDSSQMAINMLTIKGAEIPIVTGIIGAVSSWVIASNYIREYGNFIPLEILPDYPDKARYPSQLVDFNQKERKIKKQMFDYLRVR